jgi:hypothetical protein
MKIIHIVIFFSFLIFSFQDCINCNHGKCIDNEICECNEKYSNYPHGAKIKCSYKKKITMDCFFIRSNSIIWNRSSLCQKLWFWNWKINFLVNNMVIININEILFCSKRMER